MINLEQINIIKAAESHVDQLIVKDIRRRNYWRINSIHGGNVLQIPKNLKA
jgi:hypothetical protein